MQMSPLLVLSWISVAAVHAAQPQPPGNDISARVFNSADITVSSLKPGEWTSLTFDSERWDTANPGHVQSTFVVPPLTLVARKAGLRELGDLGQLGFPSSSEAFVVMQSTVERNPKEITAVLRAVTKAIRIYKTDKEAALAAIARFMKLNDREALEETWRMNAKALKDIPSPPVAGINVVRDFLAQTDGEVKKMNLEALIMPQFAERLQKEGVK